ncbi:MAG: MmgE/PrpD family protein, partial [Burkholderiales bacterium]|nr:MmgE/PrpD family protein [Burkholderiales bacterium]
GAVDVPQSVHQAKFSMGTVLGLIAVHGRADVNAFADAWRDAPVQAFRERVTMVLDPEVDAAYPARWLGRVTLRMRDGRQLAGRVDVPKGDPDNTLSRDEIASKATALARFTGAADDAEVARMLTRIWGLAQAPAMTWLREAAA